MNGYILSIDPSLNNTGYAVAKLTEQRNRQHKVEIVEVSHIPNWQFDSSQMGWKLKHVERRLYQLRDVYKPLYVIKENLATTGHDQTVKLSSVHGVIEMVFNNTPIVGYSPTRVKKDITGSGKAEKVDIQTALRKWVDMCWHTDDESDAVAILYTWLLEQGIVSA